MSLPARNRNYERLQRDWYGFERAKSEISAKLPPPKPIADALDNAVKSILPPSRLNIIKVQGEWSNIVGAVNAKHTFPSFLKNGVLFVEIAHPAFRMAVDTPKMRAFFLDRIARTFGPAFCKELKFVPGGRRR